jgi:NAD(P)H-dependent FMN reductase
MKKIQVIIGSTRPGRVGEKIALWVMEQSKTQTDIEFELIDLAAWDLPFLDEPMPPMMGMYTKDHTKKWAAKVSEADGFIFVTPEYNHGYPAALKNAIDFLHAEWNNKPVAFVGYGVVGGARAIGQLNQVTTTLKMVNAGNVNIINSRELYEPDGQLKEYEAHLSKHNDGLQAALASLANWVEILNPTRELAGV